MKKLILFLFLVPFLMLAQNPTNFPYGIKNPAAPTNTTPTYITTTSTTGLQEKIPSAYIEKTANKTSTISGYSETLYPNEKASHDALDLKLNISDLPSNLMLYPTNVASDISGYVKLVTNIHDADYNVTAVDISTPTITTTNQLVSSLITTAGVLIGQPGVFNATTFGNIRRLSGSGTANFYFKVFHRDSTGVETLIGTSSITEAVTSSSYLEFTAAMLWDDGDFIDTDRIVIKYYANRIAGSSDPVYQFQFGGTSPVRTLLPVPFSVVDAGYELNSNKQNSLSVDGTGTKYPTVDAVNAIDLQKVINVGGYAEVDGGNSFVDILSGDENNRTIRLKTGTTDRYSSLKINNQESLLRADDDISDSYSVITANPYETYLQTNLGVNQQSVVLGTPLADSVIVNFPTPAISGTYTLATTDETVNLTGLQFISGTKNFTNSSGGQGISINNNNTSQGLFVQNGSSSTGEGIFVNNGGSGSSLNLYSTFSSTGKPLVVSNVGVETLSFTKTGDVTAKSYIKTGGTSSQSLMANGTVKELVTQTITNGVTDKSPSEDAVFDALALKVSGSGTTNKVSKFTSGGVVGDSNITDTGSLVSISTDMTVNAIRVGKGGGNIGSNTALGDSTLRDNTTGSNNTGIGLQNLLKNTIGVGNVSIGAATLSNNISGNNNLAIGTQSMLNNTSASSNTAIGYQAILGNSIGNNNTILGFQGGRYLNDKTTANLRLDNSILLGYRTSVLADNQTNQIVIGYDANGLGSNTTVIGNSSTVSTWLGGNVLIGTTTDSGNKLKVNGDVSSTQYKLSALNTAPASATDTGTLGEVRITATYIYVCTATNTWVRTSLATW